MSQMFFRLTHHDWVECFTKLSRAELGVLFYLRTLNPFGDRYLKINCQAIGEVLDIHRTSVSRALKKLKKENLLELEITSAQIKLKINDTKQDSENDANPYLDKDLATFVHPRTISIPEPPPDKASTTPQTIQTYIDFKKTLSESERENFFNFVREEIKNLEKPINDLEAWLASKNAAKQNRWEIYYSNYQEQKISESKKTIKHSDHSESLTLGQKKLASAEFQKRMKINQPVDEPENINSKEFQQQQAEFNQLLDNPPEPGERKSLAQQRREQIAEVKRQQEEIKRARQEAAEERAKQLNQDREQHEQEIFKQVEELKQWQQSQQSSQNSDLEEEDGENE